MSRREYHAKKRKLKHAKQIFIWLLQALAVIAFVLLLLSADVIVNVILGGIIK